MLRRLSFYYSTATVQLTTAFSPPLTEFCFCDLRIFLHVGTFHMVRRPTNWYHVVLAVVRVKHAWRTILHDPQLASPPRASDWAHQPCIGAPRKDSRKAIWQSVQLGLASMVPLGNYKHKDPSFLCRQCAHLARPLVGHGSCFVFPSCAGTQLCAWMLAAFWRGSMLSAVRFHASVWESVSPLPMELRAMCAQ